MSKEEPVKPSASSEPPPTDDEDIRLQINLRLNIDQITELEPAKGDRPTKQQLCQLACRMYDARRTRDKLLDRGLFGEPAWDMLLALYCLPARGCLMTATALTYSADVAQGTGHRWQKILQDEGLIERGPTGMDLRKQTVRLTHKGRVLMENYLTRLFYADTPVPPFPNAAGG